eukprot:symbB.v1.2.027371.t1/scaffold2804.1/size138365/6
MASLLRWCQLVNGDESEVWATLPKERMDRLALTELASPVSSRLEPVDVKAKVLSGFAVANHAFDLRPWKDSGTFTADTGTSEAEGSGPTVAPTLLLLTKKTMLANGHQMAHSAFRNFYITSCRRLH